MPAVDAGAGTDGAGVGVGEVVPPDELPLEPEPGSAGGGPPPPGPVPPPPAPPRPAGAGAVATAAGAAGTGRGGIGRGCLAGGGLGCGEPCLSRGVLLGRAALLLVDDRLTELGLRLLVLLLQLLGERFALGLLVLERGEQRGLLGGLRVERRLVGRELLDEHLHLVGGAGALVERDAGELAPFEVVGEPGRRREQRGEPARAAGGELVDRDLRELALQHGQLAALCVDLGLRVASWSRRSSAAAWSSSSWPSRSSSACTSSAICSTWRCLSLTSSPNATGAPNGVAAAIETSAAAAAAATAARRRGPLRMTASSVPMLRRGVESVGPVTDVRPGRRHSVGRPRYARGSFLAAHSHLIRVRRSFLAAHSHSMVPGGLLVMSYATRFTPATSLMIRFDIVSSRSYGSRAQSAVIASSLVTARMMIGCA